VLLLASCGSRAPDAPSAAPIDTARFDGSRALHEARQLTLIAPRHSGSPGAERAALHLQQRLLSVGIPAQLEIFTNQTPTGPMVFRNVVGEWAGSGTNLVIVGSHYDTKSGIAGFVGANDSASSSGALIELGRTLAAGPRLPYTVRLIFFDGEECQVSYSELDGLHGSRHHADQLAEARQTGRVRAVIILDMIGDRDLTITLPRNGTPWLLSAVLEESYRENARNRFALHPHAIGDDHVPFLEAGMPAVDLIDFDYGSQPGLNDYWHTSQDTMDRLASGSLEVAGRVTLRVLNRLAVDKR